VAEFSVNVSFVERKKQMFFFFSMRSVSGVFKDAPDKAISIARLPSSTDASLTTTRTFERENIAEGLAKAISIARLPSLADYYGGFVVTSYLTNLEFFHSFQQCLLNLKEHLTFMRTDIGIEQALRGSQNLEGLCDGSLVADFS
jgi:hypothetical protein